MKIHLIIKTGVYRHEVKGAYIDFAAAKETARVCCADPKNDGYHYYEVFALDLETLVEDAKSIGGWSKQRTWNPVTRIHEYSAPVWQEVS